MNTCVAFQHVHTMGEPLAAMSGFHLKHLCRAAARGRGRSFPSAAVTDHSGLTAVWSYAKLGPAGRSLWHLVAAEPNREWASAPFCPCVCCCPLLNICRMNSKCLPCWTPHSMHSSFLNASMTCCRTGYQDHCQPMKMVPTGTTSPPWISVSLVSCLSASLQAIPTILVFIRTGTQHGIYSF